MTIFLCIFRIFSTYYFAFFIETQFLFDELFKKLNIGNKMQKCNVWIALVRLAITWADTTRISKIRNRDSLTVINKISKI